MLEYFIIGLLALFYVAILDSNVVEFSESLKKTVDLIIEKKKINYKISKYFLFCVFIKGLIVVLAGFIYFELGGKTFLARSFGFLFISGILFSFAYVNYASKVYARGYINRLYKNKSIEYFKMVDCKQEIGISTKSFTVFILLMIFSMIIFSGAFV